MGGWELALLQQLCQCLGSLCILDKDHNLRPTKLDVSSKKCDIRNSLSATHKWVHDYTSDDHLVLLKANRYLSQMLAASREAGDKRQGQDKNTRRNKKIIIRMCIDMAEGL